jgi:hypothetical protein
MLPFQHCGQAECWPKILLACLRVVLPGY